MILRHIETIDFDPSKKEHRDAVRKFMVRRAWADCPIRFKHYPEYGSLVDQVQEKLCAYYLAKETKKPAKAVNA